MLPRFAPVTCLMLPLAAVAQLSGPALDQMLDGHDDIRSDLALGFMPDDGTVAPRSAWSGPAS